VEISVGQGAQTLEPRTLGPIEARLAAVPQKEPAPAWVVTIPGARLATDAGLVVTAEGDVLAQTTWDEDQLAGSIERAGRIPPPVEIEGTVASLISLHAVNFYHWMLDALPRLAVLEEAGMSDLPLVIPEHPTGFQLQSLALLGIDSSRFIPFRREHLAPDVLVWAAPPAHTGFPTPWVVNWIRERFTHRVPDPHRRLYVSRSLVHARKLRRRVTNAPELEALLLSRGFEVVRPELLSLKEQIALFAEAAVVVGPHGAAHTHIAFSPRLTLVELFEPSFFNRCNLALAQAAGHDYWYVVGRTVGRGDVEAPLDLVDATVAAAIQTLEGAP
jgi:capsular polysaccharide biosynthesis protein